jgi:hypothetical protein
MIIRKFKPQYSKKREYYNFNFPNNELIQVLHIEYL